MIFARDKSQMCNNLLQFGHVYAWAREHNRSVCSMCFAYKYNHFKIQRTEYAKPWCYLVGKYIVSGLHLAPTLSFKYKTCDHDALEAKMLKHKNVIVFGWWVRFYDLFIKYRSEICDLFEFNTPIRDNVNSKFSNLEKEFAERPFRLGVHIRRGDYADKFYGGQYFYSDEVFAKHIRKFAQLHPELRGKLCAYISTNDNAFDTKVMEQACGIPVRCMKGDRAEDLYMLSQCDALIGPPSTFSLVGAMYRDIPLYRMDSANEEDMTLDGFKDFNYWFRRIK